MACSTASVQADLVNGDVEGGTGLADIPGWLSWGPSGALEGSYAHSGAQCVRLWWDDTGLFQNFSVIGGQTYTASGYLYTPTSERYTWDVGNNTYASLKLEWYQADGVTSAGPGIETTRFTPDDLADVWAFRSISGAAPASATIGRMVLAIGGSGPASGTVAFDSLSAVAAVPEPSTMAFLVTSLVGLPMLLRRRKA
ncbi:MAG: hypothetical protein A2X46_15015 [Lentisphaerae bacterium GWF2_57_35]|nr:MAG: hypothetical protein A2X46_15015 [Lentisphaerae bacterium GWF2_57_35]